MDETDRWLRSLGVDGLQDADAVESMLEVDRDGEYRNYAYVRTEDDTIFLLHGDQQHPGMLRGFPVYLPDEDGDREIDGRTYAKQPLDDPAAPDREYYELDPVENGAYRFPVEVVEECWDPFTGQKEALQSLDEEEQDAYTAVAAVLEDNGADHALIGSHLLGADTSGSDVDIVALTDDNMMHRIEDDLEAREDIRVATATYSHEVEGTKRRAGTTPNMTVTIATNSREHPRPVVDGVDVDILSMQETPFTDYFLPSDAGEAVEGVAATVTDASRGHYNPAVYEIEVSGTDDDGIDRSGEYDLVSFLPTYRDALEEGDAFTLTGRLYEDEDTIYLSDGVVDEFYGTTAKSYLQDDHGLRLFGEDASPDRIEL